MGAEKRKKKGLLYGPAAWWWEMQEKLEKKRGKSGGADKKGEETLCRIWGQTAGKRHYREFEIEKREKLIAVCLMGMGLAAILGISALAESGETLSSLLKPESGEGGKTYVLDASIGQEQVKGMEISVPERLLSEKEQTEVLNRAKQELETWISGKDLDRVDENLDLPVSFCGGLAEAVWQSSSYDLMDASGKIRKDPVAEDGELVTLGVKISCMEKQREYEFPVRIVPKGQEAAERLLREAKRRIQGAENKAGKTADLPADLDGQAVIWKEHKEPYGLWAAVLTVLGCVLLNFAYEKDLLKKGQERQDALLAEYPSFLSRLTLLAQTGMPVRQIFAKLAQEGAKPGAGPVYEEVLRTFREMESGMTQLEAFENFGKRIRLPQYRKCASLLAQNVRKGTGELIAALGNEAENAFEERKAAAKRKGEEAQTRLLVPMLMMLGVVMLLILVPACFSFSGM